MSRLMMMNHNYTDFDKNLEPLHIFNKDKYMDTIEVFKINKAFKTNPNYISNDEIKLQFNALYDTAMRVGVQLCPRNMSRGPLL